MNRICVYTVKQVADILHISQKTMYQIVRDRQIAVIWVRGQIRITSTALEDYIRGGKNGEKGNAGNAI